jgi:hypothetical protein
MITLIFHAHKLQYLIKRTTIVLTVFPELPNEIEETLLDALDVQHYIISHVIYKFVYNVSV